VVSNLANKFISDLGQKDRDFRWPRRWIRKMDGQMSDCCCSTLSARRGYG